VDVDIERRVIVAYQVPAGWVTGGFDLAIRSEDDEDFGSHFGRFCI
jgi:hypothetical protein